MCLQKGGASNTFKTSREKNVHPCLEGITYAMHPSKSAIPKLQITIQIVNNLRLFLATGRGFTKLLTQIRKIFPNFGP